MEFLKVVSLLGFVCLATCENTKFKERFSWKIADFDFPDEETRNQYLQSGEFIPENNLPLGLEAWRNKLFVTLPRWKAGTAASLTYIDLDATTEKSPKFKPYPNWEAHKFRQNNGVGKIANVFRVNVDVCDRLWVLDNGVVDILGKLEVIFGSKILVYDLNTDKLLFEYTLPASTVKENTFFANILVDVNKKNCDNAYAYIADLGSNALVVYNLANNDAWRVTHHYFSFDPLAGNYNVGGVNFQWTDGLFGLALSAAQEDGSRTLYFHPMSTFNEFAVSTRILQNKTIHPGTYIDPYNPKKYHEFKLLGCKGENTQSSASSLDEKTGVLFYTLLNKDAIGCWNPKKTFTPENNGIVASDSVTMIFPNDLKVDKNGTLWVLTDKIPKFMYTKLNFDEYNFRIFSASPEEAIKGTVCDNSS